MTMMSTREPTPEESGRMREAVRELAWQWARSLAGLSAGDPPRNPFDADALDAAGQQAAVLAHLSALREVRDMAEQLIAVTVTVAGATGAGGTAIGEALGVTRSAVRKKYPDAVAGRPGPREPEPTAYGREDWEGTPENGDAARDWLIRARVRVLADAQSTGFGLIRTVEAGTELELMMKGRAGSWVATDCWMSDEPARTALLIGASNARVLEILEQTSPWLDREYVIEDGMLVLEEPA